MEIVSFDIFDTALIRKCGRPEVIFDLLAHRLYPDDMAAREDFVHWRTYQAKGETIAEMYAGVDADFPEYTVQQLIDAELEIESKNLIANPSIKQLIDEVRNSGKQICFISDMYLPSTFLTKVLEREGCLKNGETVYVSCECNARKDNGSLYEYVRNKIKPKTWHHYGDNKRSDVCMARRHGINAHHIDTHYTIIEKRLIDNATYYRDGWKLKALVGLQRAARLSNGNTPEAIMAADYVAPAYIPFVNFVLKESQNRGIKLLHFLSRDGYIMQKIAKSLGDKGIKYNYLFVSRRSLMGAYLETGDIDDYMSIVDRHTLLKRDVDHMLWQLQLTRDQLKKEYDIEFPYKKILTREQEKDFLNKIFNHPVFTPHFKEQCRLNKSIFLDYIKQENPDNSECGFVDVGWLGTSRLMLSKLIERTDIPTFYMGVRRDVYPRDCGDFIPYYRSGTLDTYATALIESYFSASPWPTTVGYKYDESDKIIPIFPNGEVYSENIIIQTNVRVCQMIAEQMNMIGEIPDDILYAWSKISISSLAAMKDNDVDLTPIKNLDNFESGNVIKRLTIKDLFKLLFTGTNITACDKGSLKYTFGKMPINWLWAMHDLTSKVKGKIYKMVVRS